jgi:hypothetical protein
VGHSLLISRLPGFLQIDRQPTVPQVFYVRGSLVVRIARETRYEVYFGNNTSRMSLWSL